MESTYTLWLSPKEFRDMLAMHSCDRTARISELASIEMPYFANDASVMVMPRPVTYKAGGLFSRLQKNGQA